MRRGADVRGPAPLLRPGLWIVMGAAVLTGCHHRRPQTVVLPAQTPVPVEPVPSPADSAEIEATKPKLPPVPVASGELKPKKARRTKKAAVPVATPATPAPKKQETAETTTTAAAGIGSLTVAGDQSPQVRQDAVDLLAANERRLGALPADVQKAQAALVSKARTFQRDAQQALSSGDAAGAKTLAVKGKLLLDDLEQGNAPK